MGEGKMDMLDLSIYLYKNIRINTGNTDCSLSSNKGETESRIISVRLGAPPEIPGAPESILYLLLGKAPL
jgi:hypothetical protein